MRRFLPMNCESQNEACSLSMVVLVRQGISQLRRFGVFVAISEGENSGDAAWLCALRLHAAVA